MSQSFKRYEKKYLLDDKRYAYITEAIRDHVKDDIYKEYDLMSLYYDNDNDELIRRSIEKPLYKEKLRIRAYMPPKDDDMIQVELKKKYDGIVYKRRTRARYRDVLDDIYGCEFEDVQTGEEIRYFLKHYGKLSPKIYTGCHRTSYKGIDDEDLRITFDKDMVYRTKDIYLGRNANDLPINEGIIMEIKVKDALPLWLVQILDEAKAYPRGFSKVGNAYLKEKEKENGTVQNDIQRVIHSDAVYDRYSSQYGTGLYDRPVLHV
ncbi:MAG: polyphosphate polymerase domain-containing protein [Erysipelotrichaceae bacterium]|nr:polyphosphate polymerase domain-containing protein [Erysipelotrichaceae bacterium]